LVAYIPICLALLDGDNDSLDALEERLALGTFVEGIPLFGVVGDGSCEAWDGGHDGYEGSEKLHDDGDLGGVGSGTRVEIDGVGGDDGDNIVQSRTK
jgi:hypothetical protein